MKWLLMLWLVAGGAWAAEDEPLAVNEQKVPKSLEDLEAIRELVQKQLERARAATVCVDLGDGSGTGVIISPEGLALTAAHVSTGVRKKLKVQLEDGSEYEARTLGLDSMTDAAMIQVLGEGPFPYVEYDDSGDLELGDWVFALGHSGGFDKGRGVVLRVGRMVKLEPETVRSDCILIGGDSGGPLFDLHGKLVAIHSRVGRVKDDSQHVPLPAFRRKWDRMLESEFIGQGPFAQHGGNGWIGVETTILEEEKVLEITEVAEESPAAKAGLKKGMRIVAVDGATVEDGFSYFEQMKAFREKMLKEAEEKRKAEKEKAERGEGEEPDKEEVEKAAELEEEKSDEKKEETEEQAEGEDAEDAPQEEFGPRMPMKPVDVLQAALKEKSIGDSIEVEWRQGDETGKVAIELVEEP